MSSKSVEWEVYVEDGKWVCLPENSSSMIESGKAQGRRAILVSDEKNLPVRAFLDDFEECLESIGGSGKIRNLRRRCFPRIVLPSETMPQPKEIKRRVIGKSRELSVTEAYSRARIRIMHGGEKDDASASELVSEAKVANKKLKALKRKKKRETALGSVSTKKEEAPKGEFAQEEDDNFNLSVLETDLPKKPSLGWVLRGALFPKGRTKQKQEEDEPKTKAKKKTKTVNVEARERLVKSVLWTRARKRAKTKSGRRGAAKIIVLAYRDYRLRQHRHRAAAVIQRWIRWKMFKKHIRKAFLKAERRRRKLERQALEAAERARWTESQKGVLVALEVAYGAPKHRGDWGLRSTFIGGEGTEEEKALGSTIEGSAKTLKDIQVKWEEMHSTGALDNLELLSHVPPAVLDVILPPWSNQSHGKKSKKKKRHHDHKQSGPKAGIVDVLEGSTTPTQPASAIPAAGDLPGFRGAIPPEFRSVAARLKHER